MSSGTVIDVALYGQDCAGELYYYGPKLAGMVVRVAVDTTPGTIQRLDDARQHKIRTDFLALGASDVLFDAA